MEEWKEKTRWLQSVGLSKETNKSAQNNASSIILTFPSLLKVFLKCHLSINRNDCSILVIASLSSFEKGKALNKAVHC